MNGGQGGNNSWYIDGNYNVVGLAMNMAVDPSPDAVGGISALSTIPSRPNIAGRVGGLFSMVLKSGGNAVHGDIYDYLRNDASGRPQSLSPRLVRRARSSSLAKYATTISAGRLGGPVVIPHIYNG